MFEFYYNFVAAYINRKDYTDPDGQWHPTYGITKESLISMIREDMKGGYCREGKTGYLATFKYHNANIIEVKTQGAL